MTFEEVYKKHYKELRRFGHQMNIPEAKCEDITQETFLKFYIELQKNVIFENPRAWLYKVYLNLFRNSLKNRSSHDSLPAGDPADYNIAADIHETLIRSERESIVFEVLSSMSEREKELLILYNEGLSYSELADVLGLNPNSVGKTLVRAIEKLKQNLKLNYYELFEQG
jgi:RNA polymerase sigma-70 factor (ECF subfamily)